MINSTEKENLLLAVAKECSDEMNAMNKIHPDNSSKLKPIIDKYLEKLAPIGTTRIQLMCEIGIINKKVKDYRR